MLGNGNPFPSKIEDSIYTIMEDFEVGINIYDENLIDTIVEFFTAEYPTTEWQLGCSKWPNCMGGCCFVSWIESGHLFMISFDYKK